VKMLAALAVGLILIGVVMVVRHHDKPASTPRLKVDPSQQVGDTADLMRQLERKKLVTTTTR
jgi:hypothetical protein